MNLALPSDWPTTLAEAKALQERLRHRVVAKGEPGSLRRIAGIDEIGRASCRERV